MLEYATASGNNRPAIDSPAKRSWLRLCTSGREAALRGSVDNRTHPPWQIPSFLTAGQIHGFGLQFGTEVVDLITGDAAAKEIRPEKLAVGRRVLGVATGPDTAHR